MRELQWNPVVSPTWSGFMLSAQIWRRFDTAIVYSGMARTTSGNAPGVKARARSGSAVRRRNPGETDVFDYA